MGYNSGHLEIYLMDVDSSVEMRTNLRNIELVCEADLEGSTLLRDLHILVGANFNPMSTKYYPPFT